ncbi:hypothetical protein [Secundilactobacillus collinoides]|uniref:Uncharacterized protein n=2 Tax=Secundilactobacillus collinoides TaxID=33960 RepID=A0A0R2B425_SECCO|nr:hypothetical protein [Secundilactobacillus collinoides]KRM74136.1 hypothetical protein FC82_GL000297 [Secundilactobacillus collinoides DSM 20515 = JCM 1123]KZL38962.1 hypothetical protein TY91_11065 [Secundilactobacillus collinoides]
MRTVREQLLNAAKTGRLVEVYRYGDNAHFSVGNVLAVDDKFVLLKQVNPDGAIDGGGVYRLNTVTRVIEQSDYLKSLVAVMALARERGYGNVWQLETIIGNLDFKKHSILKVVLEWAFNSDQVVTIGEHPGKREAVYTGFLGSLKKKQVIFNYVDRSDLSARWQVGLRYANMNFVEFSSFETLAITAILERYMSEDFH